MPQDKAMSAADRGQGVNINTWPLPNGDLTLVPEDLLRGAGNLSDKNADGQPDGMKLIPTAQVEGRNVYAGTRADVTTRQNSALIPVEYPSYQMNHDMADGDPAPGAGTPLALLPTPGKPTVVLEPAEKAGYPLATPEKPHWIAFGFEETGKHSDPGPAISFTGGQGQSYRITLPEEIGEATTGIDIWMAEPGTSTASTPGKMRIQYTVDIRSYSAPTFDMTGPYRYETDVSDEVGALKKPILQRIIDHRTKSIPAIWYAAVMAVMEPGSIDYPGRGNSGRFAQLTPLSQSAGPLEMPADTTTRWFGLEEPASEGVVRITRPALPPGAKGWIALVFSPNYGNHSNHWLLVIRAPRLQGTTVFPIPVETTYIEFTGRQDTAGWLPINFDVLTDPLQIPTFKVTPPDFKPEAPVAFDASRLPPGHYYFRVAEESGGLEGPVSPYEEVDVGENDIPRIIFDNPKNRIPNATLRELDASGLPLSYTIDTTGGSASVVAGELLVQTDGVQTGTTPSVLTAQASVDPTQEWTVYLSLKMDNPPRGTLAGQVQAVLRQIDANGVATDTVHGTLSAPGEYVVKEKIRPAGSIGTYVWSTSTVEAQLLYRFSGASKNALMRISKQNLKGYGWFFRRRQYKAGPLALTNVPPEAIATPGTDVALEPPPPVPLPPAGETIPNPDRPGFSGAVLESFGFEPGLPGGWSQNVTGTALLDTNAAAALSGSLGLRLRKTAGGTLSSATLAKTFAPPSGLTQRHDTGSLGRYRVQSLSSGHYLDLHPLCRPDGSKFAWLRYANAFEQAELTINSSPSQPGNVTLNLGGVATDVAVVALKETATLSITGTPTTPGLVSLSVGGSARNVALGGTTEEFTIRIDTRPTTRGYVALTVNGIARNILVGRGATQERVAQIIAAYPVPGYRITYSGRTIRYRAVLAGPRADPTFNPRTTGVQATKTMIAQGSIEAASTLAQRIRETDFPGFTTGGTGTSVDFTAIQAGVKANASYNPRSTGATGTMNTTQEGSADTPQALAARIRGTTISGWTLGGADNVVTIISTTVGQKQNASYSAGLTGARGTMETLVQGSSGDVSALIKDAAGNEYHRRMLTNIGTTIFNADISVSGAAAEDDEGNSYEEAIINFWVSTGTSTKTLLGRFEAVDLTDYPAGRPQLGVVAESSASATWEVHVDDVKITDRGETYFDEHDYTGALLDQAYYNGVPDQPLQDDVFIVGEPIAVIPGEQVTFRARARWDGVPSSTPAKPLFLVGRIPEDLAIPGSEFIELGDILGGSVGISGTSDWSEPTTLAPITIPENCFEVSFASRDMSAGEIVIQQIAASVGTTVKRTPLYATNGTYRASLSIATPSKPLFLNIGRERKLFRAITTVPTGTTATLQFRSGDLQPDESIVWDSWQVDPLLVAEKNELEAEVTMTGDGINTPTIPFGSPVADYALLLGSKDLGTLLRSDGSELPGGVFFEIFEEWEDLSEIIIHPKPGGDFDRQSPYSSVPKLLPCTILAFTPEGRRYLAKNWGKELFVVEDERIALTIKIRSLEPFSKQVPRRTINGQVFSVYQAKMGEAVIVARQELP